MILDERPRSDVSYKYSWQCSNCKCRLSIRYKSCCFQNQSCLCKSGSSFRICGEYPVSDAAEEAEISSRVAIDIWLREVCTAKLLQTQIILGGPGVVVQIDESLFRHKTSASIK